MIAAIVILGIVTLATLAFAAWREHEHRAQLSEWADRIQAPAAVQIAAVERAVAEREPAQQMPDLYSEPVPQSDDLRLEALMEGS